MKMTRNQLKSIVKECLVEILAEGMGTAINEVKTAPRRMMDQPRQQPIARPRLPSALDLPAMQPKFKEAIREITSDPVMASIFADTANTTLIEQNSRGHFQDGGAPMSSSGMGDRAARVVAANDPEQLFGADVTEKWADAAFAPPLHGSRPTIATRGLRPDCDPYAPNPEIKPA